MGSRAYDSTKPTFYLDHSTLVDAFKSHLPGANVDPAYVPLKGWVERVAVEANLCLSVVHMAELGGWGAAESGDAMARWYGSLPIVWMPLIQHVQGDEIDHWTKVAVGVTTSRYVPYASSVEAAFRTLDTDGIDAMNRNGEPELALVTVARTQQWRDIWEQRYVRQYVSMVVSISENHRSMRETLGWTDDAGRQQIAANFEESVRRVGAAGFDPNGGRGRRRVRVLAHRRRTHRRQAAGTLQAQSTVSSRVPSGPDVRAGQR
jgi:hypothetical protein